MWQSVTSSAAGVDGPWPGLRGAYPELFALVGSHVPDFRGLFLRGHGGASGALGVKQGYAVPDTFGKGWFSGGQVGAGGVDAMADGKVFSVKETWCCYAGGSTWAGATMDFNLVGDTPTADEIRPVNTAVRYLIRARS